MEFFANSERFVLVAWVAGLTTVALSLALTLEVLRMRWRATRRAQRQSEFVRTWRPILFDALLGGAPTLPPIQAPDEDSFLRLWNEIQGSLHADARPALNRVAEAVGAAARARALVAGDAPVRCVQALQMLGYLGRPEDYEAARRLLDDPRAYLSLAAARTLVHIDPVRSLDDLLPRIAARTDWPASLLMTVLGGADAPALAGRLRAALAKGVPATIVRLLPLVALTDARTGDEMLGDLFGAATDPEVMAAVLKVIRTPALLDLARAGCHHRDWSVRTQAAAALGRVGGVPDQARLVALLSDPEWWVRYRAAQALVAAGFGSPGKLAMLIENNPDRYARDILAHAAAESRS